MTERISHLVRIRSTPTDVFECIATTDGIAAWFTQANSREYREGGDLELVFPDQRVQFRIAEFKSPTRVVWQCISESNPWFGTDIVFELEARGEQTWVRFDQLGWPDVTDLFRDCSMSWAYFLESLKSLIEEGRGTPESVAPRCESTNQTSH